MLTLKSLETFANQIASLFYFKFKNKNSFVLIMNGVFTQKLQVSKLLTSIYPTIKKKFELTIALHDAIEIKVPSCYWIVVVV
jgi:hypothetical protein